MNGIDEFRFRSQAFLLELDRSTTRMMMVSAGKINGTEWLWAVKGQHDAYYRWLAFLNEGNVISPFDHH